jgi:hypothetical protein
MNCDNPVKCSSVALPTNYEVSSKGILGHIKTITEIILIF